MPGWRSWRDQSWRPPAGTGQGGRRGPEPRQASASTGLLMVGLERDQLSHAIPETPFAELIGIAQVGAATVCVWVGGVKSSSIPSERWSGRRDAGASPPAHPHSNQSGAYRGVAFRSVVPIRDERWLVEVEDALRAVELGLVWRPAAGRLSTDKAWTLVTPRVWTLMTQLVVIPWTLVTHTNS